MPGIDKRNTIEHLHTGGSDVGLQVYLTADEAVLYFGTGSVAGWYTFGTFEGGTIAYTIDGEDDKDETGQLTGKTIERSAEFVLTNTIKETSDAVEDLVDNLLTKVFKKYRYALPAGQIQTAAGPPAVMGPAHKVFGIERGKVTPGFEISTSDGEKRTRGFELKSTKYLNTPAFVRATVSLASEADWPAKLTPFKTAP